MAKKLIIFLAVTAIAFAVAWYWYNKPRQGVKGKAADVQVTAAELYNAYSNNEQAADKKFLNAIVEVRGTVEEIQVIGNDAVVVLNVQPGGGGTSCRFSSASVLDSAKAIKGTEVVIKGKCTGFNMDVNLTDCEIVL
ncbi:MAG: hypothetical protein KF746_15910 [Chitinophagaceae bacterium]|nr:hypothetical protein [Chitinophagaceae bacterium]